ncbi:MAG: NAD(P)H-binding protein [Candidatus Hydrogenedentes bacterium]|nr:NAD(P)H-binding protein [Candidatus Hydrogenedentota bacterium]
MRVLVTGANGYIGLKLIPQLLNRGHEVVAFVRDKQKLGDAPWRDKVDVREGDVLRAASIPPAMMEVEAAYYLVHSMGGGRDFEDRDKKAATNFADAAQHLKKVIYLGGLMPPKGKPASKHLASRAEVGRILREKAHATEFRAGPIIGNGSASFDVVRYLANRLPVMVAPRWVKNKVQPIAIRNILAYLTDALERDTPPIVEVGADPVTFREMIDIYAEEKGIARVMFTVPVLTPWLSAQWIGLVTPIRNSVAVPIVEGMVQPLLVQNDAARQYFPHIQPMPYRKAVKEALEGA